MGEELLRLETERVPLAQAAEHREETAAETMARLSREAQYGFHHESSEGIQRGDEASSHARLGLHLGQIQDRKASILGLF